MIRYRLRPTVFATPMPTGVHVRGWASSFTLEGGADLWQVWQALSRQLAGGVPAEGLAPPEGLPPAVRNAVGQLLDQLREHDLLVPLPEGWGEPGVPGLPPPRVAGWLEAVAGDPAAVWARLREVSVEVSGRGPVAAAARRALRGAGLRLADPPASDAEQPAGAGAESSPGYSVLLVARDGRSGAVVTGSAAGAGAEVAFVAPAGRPERLRADLAALADRLDAGTGDPPTPLAALAGAAAAHRLVCAVGGLRDPADESADAGRAATDPVRPAHPAVLVVRPDPLRATYHPWLGHGGPPPPEGPADIDAALGRLDALCDPELGLIPAPRLDDLPQLPAALAVADDVPGVGITGDAARLDAGLRAARRLLGAGVAVGLDARHARGVALRRAVHETLGGTGTPVGEPEWAAEPATRRWWKALTLRFGQPARARVRRLAPDAVHAEILVGEAVLAWAVEATAGAAAMLAALAATGTLQARAAGLDVADGEITLTAGCPGWRPADDGPTAWSVPAWHWPADGVDAEERLQADLARLLGAEPAPVHAAAPVHAPEPPHGAAPVHAAEPVPAPAPPRTGPDGAGPGLASGAELVRALVAAGFAVAELPPPDRAVPAGDAAAVEVRS